MISAKKRVVYRLVLIAVRRAFKNGWGRSLRIDSCGIDPASLSMIGPC